MALIDVLNKHSKNGVLLLDDVKSANYPLYKYCTQNIDSITLALSDIGIHLVTRNDHLNCDKAKFLLMYHYGAEVNTSTLYKQNRRVYNYLCTLGEPVPDILAYMGFKVTNNKQQALAKELAKITKNGYISHMDRKTYLRVYYMARKKGVTVKEYLATNGIIYKLNNSRDKEVHKLRRKGMLQKDIAQTMGISRGTVARILNTKGAN